MKKSIVLLATSFLFLSGCVKKRNEFLADAYIYYIDGFENYSAVDSGFYSDAGWRGNQLTYSNNSISIDTTIVHSGSKSLKCYAQPTGETVSKAAVLKNNFGFPKKSTIVFSAWYYIDATSLDNLFIADFEEPATISSSPGVRLIFQNNGELAMERNKMNRPTLSQTIPTHKKFPLRQWVHVQVEMLLSQRNNGFVKIWQDDELILDQGGVATIPKDFVYVTQGTTGIMRQMEVGITANSSTDAVTMYVDDVEIRRVD